MYGDRPISTLERGNTHTEKEEQPMTEAEYKKETAWYKRHMKQKIANPQPKAVRDLMYMVTACIGQSSDQTPFYVTRALTGTPGVYTPERYSSLANYWTERLKKG